MPRPVRAATVGCEIAVRHHDCDAVRLLEPRKRSPAFVQCLGHCALEGSSQRLPCGHRVHHQQRRGRVRGEHLAELAQLPQQIDGLPGPEHQEPAHRLLHEVPDQGVGVVRGRQGRRPVVRGPPDRAPDVDLQQPLEQGGAERVVRIHENHGQSVPPADVGGEVAHEDVLQQHALAGARLAVDDHQLAGAQAANPEVGVDAGEASAAAALQSVDQIVSRLIGLHEPGDGGFHGHRHSPPLQPSCMCGGKASS
mmetsp:Transcript_51152/g.144090  ORF Transcript_51152/g.144090 Transcript_51152/m.144090 type:complete len:252 (+) Transcript_51152:308-1063(+)